MLHAAIQSGNRRTSQLSKFPLAQRLFIIAIFAKKIASISFESFAGFAFSSLVPTAARCWKLRRTVSHHRRRTTGIEN
jgi:hypothetical protein